MGVVRFFSLLILVLTLTACGPGPTEKKKETTQLLMGTLVTISTWGLSAAEDEKAVTAAFREMARVEALLSSHKPESAISRVNASPRGFPRKVDAEVLHVMREAMRFQELSGGAFDPGLRPLVRLWRFSETPPPVAPPSRDEVTAWLQARGGGVGVELTDGGMVLLNRGVGLDLGGIAKGYAIDRAVSVLREHGVKNAIVNAGGDMRVMGDKGGAPWRIGVQHPRNPDNAIAVVDLSGDIAMVTSGDYERYFVTKERRYHHVLNPGTGYPAESGLMSVSVQASTAMAADALSTAVFVMGPKRGLAFLKQAGAEGMLIDAQGRKVKTPGFREASE